MKLLHSLILASTLSTALVTPTDFYKTYSQDAFITSSECFTENEKNLIAPDEDLKAQAESLNAEVLVFQTITENDNTDFVTSLVKANSKKTVVEKNIYLIPKDKDSGKAPRSAVSKSGSQYIVSNAARINISIVYDSYTDASHFEYGKLLSTSGSVSGFNSGFRFGHAEITLGSSGVNFPSQNVTYSSYSTSWSFNAPSGWGYNLMDNGYCSIGSKVIAYITRDGSTMYSGVYQLNA